MNKYNVTGKEWGVSIGRAFAMTIGISEYISYKKLMDPYLHLPSDVETHNLLSLIKYLFDFSDFLSLDVIMIHLFFFIPSLIFFGIALGGIPIVKEK